MQKTTFKYEVLIHDDASTDNTADIIREFEAKYPDIIKPIYQTENQYKKGKRMSYEYQLPRARGKYIAMCEGDDYWTDPYKLQKQVSFLESHPDYGFIGSGFVHIVENGGGWRVESNIERLNEMEVWRRKTLYKEPAEREGNIILFGNVFEYAKCDTICQTVSLVYRKDVVGELHAKSVGDITLQAILAHNSKYAYLDEETCVYRIQKNSLSHDRSLEGRLRFCHWRNVTCKARSEIFPGDFEHPDWVKDDENYIRFLIAVRDGKYDEAASYKSKIKKYGPRGKRYCWMFRGRLTFPLLRVIVKMKFK